MLLNKRLLLSVLVYLSTCSVLSAMHHANRFFPFLERPRPYKIKNFFDFSPSVFYTNATVAFNNSEDKIPIPLLFGEYNIKDVIDSYQQVTENIKNQTFTNPFITIGGAEGNKFIDKTIKYQIQGKVKSAGFALNYEQKLFPPLNKNISLGFFIPFMQVTSQQSFDFKWDYRSNTQESYTGFEPLQEGEKTLINRVRRKTHELIGLTSEDYVEFGAGDLTTYLKYHNEWNYSFLMRSINLDTRFGLIAPMGKKRDIDSPSSVAFMGDSHWGIYPEITTEFELREGRRLGLMLGYLYQFKKTKRLRMPVGNEPFIFSALTGKASVKPGNVFKISPYIVWGSLTDGLSGHLRWTHLRHGMDSITDSRSENEQNSLASNLSAMETFSKWVSNYFTLEAIYDSKESMKNWPLKPKFFVTYDFPFDWFKGRRSIRTQQVSFGVELHF
ncbi:hypothetical protein KAW80_03220 [Candidatus Babeliales bacterium]|nr:hypothetical protein [Candidatus Babeliales bacterium]